PPRRRGPPLTRGCHPTRGRRTPCPARVPTLTRAPARAPSPARARARARTRRTRKGFTSGGCRPYGCPRPEAFGLDGFGLEPVYHVVQERPGGVLADQLDEGAQVGHQLAFGLPGCRSGIAGCRGRGGGRGRGVGLGWGRGTLPGRRLGLNPDVLRGDLV